MSGPWAARLRALGTGPLLWLALGLGVNGVATYAFLTFSARSLGTVGFAPLSTFWTLMSALGIGAFTPLEQEVSRSTAQVHAHGGGNVPAVRTALAYTGVLLGATALLALVYADFAAEVWFADDVTLVLLFLVAMAGQALAYLYRGLLSGNDRLRRYAAQFLVEGLLRVAGALAMLLAGVTSVTPFALLLAVSPVAAVLLTTPSPRRLVRRGTGPAAQVPVRGMALLLVTSAAAQLLANAGPPTIGLLADASERAAAGPFLAGLVLARVPLFLFAAVQAVYLPTLARAVGSRDRRRFSSVVRLVLAGTVVASLLAVVACALAGPEVVQLLFGADFHISRTVMVLLAVSGGTFMVASVLAQTLLALRGERVTAAAWTLGLVAYVGFLALPGDVSDRVAVALALGTTTVVVLMGALVVRRVSQWPRTVEPAP